MNLEAKLTILEKQITYDLLIDSFDLAIYANPK